MAKIEKFFVSLHTKTNNHLNPTSIMTIEFKKEQDTVTVLLNGRLDNAAVNNITTELEPLKHHKDKHVIFDCSGLQFISLSGLRLFSSLQNTLMLRGCYFTLSNVAASVLQIITVTGFVTLIRE